MMDDELYHGPIITMARAYCLAENVLPYVAVLALMMHTVEAQATTTNPFSDPKDDPNNPLRYIASNTLTATALVLVLLVAITQTFYTFRYGGKWMLAMVIGAYTYAAGFGCRFGLHYQPDSLGIYIIEDMLIVLSPCAFIAANYVLLGRLARHLSCTSHVLLPVQKLTRIFVASDITTFCIQAAGGTISVSHNLAEARAGPHVFLAGLVIQLASFTLFTFLFVRFLYRVYTLERDVWERDKGEAWYRDWRTLAGAIGISCIGILVRSCYRVAEESNGFISYLSTTEAYFYALDTLPILVAISVYVLVWPGWFIKNDTKTIDVETKASL